MDDLDKFFQGDEPDAATVTRVRAAMPRRKVGGGLTVGALCLAIGVVAGIAADRYLGVADALPEADVMLAVENLDRMLGEARAAPRAATATAMETDRALDRAFTALSAIDAAGRGVETAEAALEEARATERRRAEEAEETTEAVRAAEQQVVAALVEADLAEAAASTARQDARVAEATVVREAQRALLAIAGAFNMGDSGPAADQLRRRADAARQAMMEAKTRVSDPDRYEAEMLAKAESARARAERARDLVDQARRAETAAREAFAESRTAVRDADDAVTAAVKAVGAARRDAQTAAWRAIALASDAGVGDRPRLARLEELIAFLKARG